jgi:oligopeptide/dipeptide ABC transporter ATP-binding protein
MNSDSLQKSAMQGLFEGVMMARDSNPSPSLLEIRDLRVAFQTEQGLLTAVDEVDFTLRSGRTLGLVGESGCGKSVTARAIMRLLEQPAGRVLKGEVLLEGRDLLQLPLESMRKVRGKEVAMIFQEPMTALNPVQRVGRQIIENILLHENMDHRAALKRAVELMEWVGIPAPDQRVNEYPHQLSGGMRQRVMIAMALSCRPKVLIADEPTTALDVTVQAQILDLINRLQKETGMAVILITHDLGVVAETCDDVAVMYAGRIVERGPVLDIFKHPRHPYTRGLMNCLPKLDHPSKTPLPVIPGMVPGLRDMPVGCRFAARCPNAHDPSVTLNRPPWQECGEGHGVEACACFATELTRNSSNSQNLTPSPTPIPSHENQTGTNPPGTLESALAYLGAGAGTTRTAPGGQKRTEERIEQFRKLLEWAHEQDKLISANRWLTPEELGAEHRIYFDETRHCAIKLTNTWQAGMTYHLGEPVAATPIEYLERWQRHNTLFADQVWLEGVVDTPSGPCLAVGQVWIEGDVPQASDILDLMKELGFQATHHPEHFFRPTDGLVVMDCHEGNFILGQDGLLYPIDVIPVPGDSSLLAILGTDS